MKKISILSVLACLGSSALVVSLTFSAVASDDLLNILEGTSKDSGERVAVGERSPLRKLFPKLTAEQNIFFQHFEANDFERALFQWTPAFENSPFAKSESGRALRSFILFQSGLQLIGLEDVLSIEKVTSIDPFIVQLWRQAAHDQHPAWSNLWLSKWNVAWTEVFGLNAEIKVRSRQLDAFRDGEVIRDLMVKSKPGTLERNLIAWQLVLSLINEDTGKAAQALAHLIKQPNNPIGRDLLDLTAARMLFQNGYLDAAIQYYEKIPKTSDFWFEAQEEIAWSHLRKGKPQDALAVTNTLNRPYFAILVGPEASFLRALAQLKVCDYTGVVASLSRFRTDFRERTARLLEVVANANTPAIAAIIEKRSQGKIDFASMGPNLKEAPRWAPRDMMLGNLIRFERGLRGERDRAAHLYAKSMSLGSDRVGFQGDMENLKNNVEQRRRAAEVQQYKRVQDLANQEVQETKLILSKLHIVEAELLQQGMMADRVLAAKDAKATLQVGAKNQPQKYQVKFPAEKEVWFDELAHYNVNLTGSCEANKRRE